LQFAVIVFSSKKFWEKLLCACVGGGMFITNAFKMNPYMAKLSEKKNSWLHDYAAPPPPSTHT